MVQLTVEVREEGGELHGVLVQEGRAASGGRSELFAPGSVSWPSTGVNILTEHHGQPEAQAFPHRDQLGRIQIRGDGYGRDQRCCRGWQAVYVCRIPRPRRAHY